TRLQGRATPGLLDCSNCRWSRDHFHKKCRRSRANLLQVSARLSALDPTQQRTSQQNLAGSARMVGDLLCCAVTSRESPNFSVISASFNQACAISRNAIL